MDTRLCVLEAKTDHILRMVRRLETLDQKTDRLLELVTKQQDYVTSSGTHGDDICQDPLSDVTAVTGDGMAADDEIVTGDVMATDNEMVTGDNNTGMTCHITDVIGHIKVETGDFTVASDTSAGDGGVTEADVITAAMGDITRDTSDVIATASVPQQAGEHCCPWFTYFLIGMRHVCSLLETKTLISAEDVAVLSQLRCKYFMF